MSPSAPRVRRFDGAFGAEGCGGALRAQFYKRRTKEFFFNTKSSPDRLLFCIKSPDSSHHVQENHRKAAQPFMYL